MKVTAENGCLVIRLKLTIPSPSRSGKSLLVVSTRRPEV